MSVAGKLGIQREDRLLAPEQFLKKIQGLGIVTNEDDLVVCLHSHAMQEPSRPENKLTISPTFFFILIPFKHEELATPLAMYVLTSSPVSSAGTSTIKSFWD